MDIDNYKVIGSKKSAYKLILFCLCSVVWGLAQSSLSSYITGCYGEIGLCTLEQINLTLMLTPLSHLPQLFFAIFILVYSVKVLIELKLPPKGFGFPFSIDKVIKRDHYTFGITGVTLSFFVIIAIVKNIYDVFSITNI